MDVFKKFKELVEESLLCKSFKGLSAAKRSLCAIALAPFIALYVCMLLEYWFFSVIYRFSCSMLDYTHAFIIKERTEVRHATEAVIYAIAFPFIFFMKLLIGSLFGALMVIHFFTSMVGYIATFGGITFSPFLSDNVDRFTCREAVKHIKSAVIIFIAFALVLLALSLSFVRIADAVYQHNKENEILDEFTSLMRKAKVEEKISNDVWNEFAINYNADKITADNIDTYATKYLGYSATAAIWDETKDVEFYQTTTIIQSIIVSAYILFTAIYVSVYSNVIKRRKSAEVCEQAE